MAAVRHLDLLFAYLDHREEYLAVFIVVQNLVGIDAVASIVYKFLHFCEFGWKMPIHVRFLIFFWGGGFNPMRGRHISETPKGTFLRGKIEFVTQIVRIGPLCA